MTRRPIALACVVVGLLAPMVGCGGGDDEPPAANTTETSSSSPVDTIAPATRDVPIDGTVLGEWGRDMTAPECDAGAIWRFNSSGTGEMSDLGTVEYELSHCTHVDPDTGLYVAKDGEIVFTVANGDTLVVDEEGEFEVMEGDTGFTGEGTWTAVGGTGRFADATGSGIWDAIGDIPGGDELFGLPDGYNQFDFTGSISYSA